MTPDIATFTSTSFFFFHGYFTRPCCVQEAGNSYPVTWSFRETSIMHTMLRNWKLYGKSNLIILHMHRYRLYLQAWSSEVILIADDLFIAFTNSWH